MLKKLKKWNINKKIAVCNAIAVLFALLVLAGALNFYITDHLNGMVLNNIDISESAIPNLTKEILIDALKSEVIEVNAMQTHLQVILFGSSCFAIFFIVLFNMQIVKLFLEPLSHVNQAMTEISGGLLGKQLDIVSEDEMGQICHSYNLFAVNLKRAIDKMKESSEFLKNISQSLGVSTTNVKNISQKQSHGLKEIIETMDQSGQVAKVVNVKSVEVSKIATDTKDHVQNGCTIIGSTVEKINIIKDHGKNNVTNVRTLSEKMENVSEIVKTINGIASQTKMIAFNAELAATEAGEAGTNFKIVAMEIRRLSDNIMQATSGIKMRILEAQTVVDHIIVSSEESSAKIEEGWKEFQKLRRVFDVILTSSEISSTSAQHIAASISDLVGSFHNVLNTLKELCKSVDTFTELTEVTNYTSDTVNEISGDFQQIVSQYKTVPVVLARNSSEES